MQSVARQLEIEADNGDSVEFLECEIVKKLFETMWKKLTPKQREDLRSEMEKAMGAESGAFAFKTSAALFAAITAANLTGFGIYILSTTVLGALTGAIGITLPFVFYTALTRSISILTGPVGVAIATAFSLCQLTGPNWKRTTMAIAYISMLRNAPQSQMLATSEQVA